MQTCEVCKKYNLRFQRNYAPDEFIEGKLSSKIWIVGLNPSGVKLDGEDKRSKKDLARFFDNKTSTDKEYRKKYSYFKDFRKVHELLFNLLGEEDGVAHTDIVKCVSDRFLPKGITRKQAQDIIKNCSCYIERQILLSKPKMIICNGSDVCKAIERIIPVIDGTRNRHRTHYIGSIDGNAIIVVLSGFIGRIDDYAKRRLGDEIEQLMNQIDDI
ncbi:MAG: hypothetical protein FIA99_04245 [Ruminiclostridium sp.]|nr:hypothetical protein [Ruminiclostridium sp.]